MRDFITAFYDRPGTEPRALDLALPDQPSDVGLMLVHGGGWFAGTRDLFHPHLALFSRKGCTTASIGYRTDPSASLEDRIEDMVSGYLCTLRTAEEHGHPIRRLIAIGSSAGAHLLSVAATRLTNADVAIHAFVLLNPPGTLQQWPSMNPDIREPIERLIGRSYSDPTSASAFLAASPDQHVPRRPTTFVFVLAGKEHFFPHPEVYRLVDRLGKSGHETRVIQLPDAEHGYFYTLRTAETEATTDEILRLATITGNRDGRRHDPRSR